MRKRNLANRSSDEVGWLTLKLADGVPISNLSLTLDQINDPVLKKTEAISTQNVERRRRCRSEVGEYGYQQVLRR